MGGRGAATGGGGMGGYGGVYTPPTFLGQSVISLGKNRCSR